VEENFPFETKKKRKESSSGHQKLSGLQKNTEFQLFFKILPGRNQSI